LDLPVKKEYAINTVKEFSTGTTAKTNIIQEVGINLISVKTVKETKNYSFVCYYLIV
jgi:hypothetical protein